MLALSQEIWPSGFSFGPLGSTVILTLNLVLAIIVYRQRAWRSTAEAAVTEKTIHKDAADRLRSEAIELRERAVKAEARTDLQPLSASLTAWIGEGRERFKEATQQLNQNTSALRALIEEVKAQRSTSEDSYRTMQAAFILHTTEDKAAQLQTSVSLVRLGSIIEALEVRLNISSQN